ncbi:hypothetical protein BH18CHL2_BH18CHL2_07060 [soil metagenome]
MPVTKRSGKAKSVGFRWACNKRLRRGHDLGGQHPACVLVGPRAL